VLCLESDYAGEAHGDWTDAEAAAAGDVTSNLTTEH